MYDANVTGDTKTKRISTYGGCFADVQYAVRSATLCLHEPPDAVFGVTHNC